MQRMRSPLSLFGQSESAVHAEQYVRGKHTFHTWPNERFSLAALGAWFSSAQYQPPGHSLSPLQKKRVQNAAPSTGEVAWQEKPCASSQSALGLTPRLGRQLAPQMPGPSFTGDATAAQNALGEASSFVHA
jgi:hypothetical protein